jgi:hypothetical protein
MLKNSIKFILALLIITWAVSNFAFAGENKTSGKLHGYVIPEYYFVASHHTDGEAEGDISGAHGFWFRRVYLGYDFKFNGYTFRLRFEGNSPAFGEGTVVPFVKDLYLKKKLGGGNTLTLGIFSPPSFDKIEKFWGYRYIEKTPLDLFKLASSRDTGIGISGGKNFIYTIMYANFGSNKGEDNQGKGIFGRIGYKNKSVYLEANGYFAADGSKDYILAQGFAGYKGKFGNIGINFAYKNQAQEGEDDKNTSLMSAFGHFKVGKKTAIVLRYDHFFDVNLKEATGYVPFASTIAPARFLIAGIDIKVNKYFQFGPNVKVAFYGVPAEAGIEKPGSDFYINLTGKIKFESKL